MVDDKFVEQALKLGVLIDDARAYLMTVKFENDQIRTIVETTLEKLGFGKTGVESNFLIK